MNITFAPDTHGLFETYSIFKERARREPRSFHDRLSVKSDRNLKRASNHDLVIIAPDQHIKRSSLVELGGIEPPTLCLQSRCSPN